MKCPKCNAKDWPNDCEQAECIRRFGECIVCRFTGSGAGTTDEFDDLSRWLPSLEAAVDSERVNKHAAQYVDLRIKMDEAEAKIAELQASADLRWKADMRAIERWRATHPGKELVWPGHDDLCVWLMGELDEANARIATAPTGYLTSKSGAGPCNIVAMDGATVFDANAYGAKVRIVPDVTG